MPGSKVAACRRTEHLGQSGFERVLVYAFLMKGSFADVTAPVSQDVLLINVGTLDSKQQPVSVSGQLPTLHLLSSTGMVNISGSDHSVCCMLRARYCIV